MNDDRLMPVMSEVGFLECDAAVAAKACLEWELPIQAKRGVAVGKRHVDGDLAARIQSLFPLTSVERRRRLFLPTQSQWTAFLDNGWRGTDAFSTVSYLCTIIGCQGIRAVALTEAGGKEGATIFTLYSPSNEGCSFLNTKRSVFAANDGGAWKFEANGEPLGFEEPSQYKTRRIRDRFNPEMLDRYLSHFGIHFFSSEFYEVQSPAELVYKSGPTAEKLREYSLDDIRKLG